MKSETKGWLDLAQEHYDNALFLYESRRYSMTIYCCHQALEMILKAAIIEFADITPSKIHKLDELARQSKLKFPNEWYTNLAELTSHYWRVRYPDFQKYVYTTREKIQPAF